MLRNSSLIDFIFIDVSVSFSHFHRRIFIWMANRASKLPVSESILPCARSLWRKCWSEKKIGSEKENSRRRKQEMKRNWWKRKQRKFNLLLPNSVCHFEYLSDRDCAMVQAYYRLNLYSGKRARNEKKKKITRKNERNRRYYLFGIFRRWFHNRLSEEIS